MLYTVGDFLKNIRSERGISLEQVSNATHIKIRFLEALENNHYGILPSEVQAKGFLRLYAGFLGIPEYPLVEAWTNRGSLRVTRTAAPGVEQDFHLEEDEPNDSDRQPSAVFDIPAEGTEPYHNLTDHSTTNVKEEFTPAVSVQSDSDFPEVPESAEETLPDQPLIESSTPNSRELFQELGHTLKNQREALGLALDEIERYTRIRARNIELIENGQIDKLPSPVQGQGMLSNYARFLEMDHDELLTKYADGLQANRLEKLSELELEKQNSKRSPFKRQATWRQFITPDLLIGSSLILVLLVVSVWSVAQVSSSRSKSLENQSTAPSIAEVLQVTPSYLPPILTETAMAAITPTRRHSDYDNITAGEQIIAATAVLSDSELPPFENNDPLQLYIIPNQRAWIRVTADNEVVFDGRLAPGNTYQYSAQNNLNLLSGNAAALSVYFNQQDLGNLGIVGQVLDMDFSAEGIQTPTLLPTETPTPTLPGSETPSLPSEIPSTPTITPFIP